MLDALFDQVVRNSALGAAAMVLVLGVRWVAGRRLAASVRCMMWLPVAALLVAPQLPDLGLRQPPRPVGIMRVTARVSVEDGSSFTEQTSTPLMKVPSPGFDTTEPQQSFVIPMARLWAAGALLTLGGWALSFIMLSRRVRRMAEPVSEELTAVLAESAQAMGLRRSPPLLATRAVRAPAVMGWLRPVLLVPPALMTTLTGQELRMVLMHECAHVRRRDLLSHWLSLALLSLHWFNPFCWLALRLLRADREAACDAAVLAARASDQRSLYGHTLLKLGSASGAPLRFRTLVGVLGSVDMLRSRIVEIAHFGKSSAGAGRLAMGLALIAATSLALYAAEPPQPKLAPVTTRSEIAAAPASPSPSPELLTRVYKVAPDFISATSASPDEPHLTAKELLSKQGVEFPEGALALFNPSTSQLTVKNTVANLERVRRIAEKSANALWQVYLTTKVVVFDKKLLGQGGELARVLVELGGTPVPAPNTSAQPGLKASEGSSGPADDGPAVQLTDPQYQVIMRRIEGGRKDAGTAEKTSTQAVLSQVTGIHGLPSITTKSGTKATVEVVREFYYPTEYGPSTNQGGVLTPIYFVTKPLGASISLEPVIQDSGTMLSLDYAATFAGLVEMREFKAESGEKLQIPAFQTNVKRGSVTLPAGHTVAFAMNEVPVTQLLAGSKKGKDQVKSQSLPGIVFITAALIDPTGRPAK